MHVVTNPGSNLSAAIVERYGLRLSPQRIVVDGVSHDTRDEIPLAEVDRWTATAREWPYVVGTTAAELANLFLSLVRDDPAIVCVTTSRKIIQTYAAATVAARTTKQHPQGGAAEIAVVDSGVTDLGTGLLTVLAAEAAAAKWPLARVTSLLERHAAKLRMLLALATLENLVKGGRASHLRVFLANILQRRPITAFQDGELRPATTVRTDADPTATLVDLCVKQVGTSAPVWAAVFHGRAPEKAQRLGAALRRAFRVSYLLERPLSSSIYLHGGPGAVGVAILPLDAEAQTLPTPTVT